MGAVSEAEVWTAQAYESPQTGETWTWVQTSWEDQDWNADSTWSGQEEAQAQYTGDVQAGQEGSVTSVPVASAEAKAVYAEARSALPPSGSEDPTVRYGVL